MLTRNKTTALLVLLVILTAAFFFLDRKSRKAANPELPPGTLPIEKKMDITWKAPAETEIPEGERGVLIRYGKDLIAHTAKYYGKKGIIAPITNGMNCQNCHLEA